MPTPSNFVADKTSAYLTALLQLKNSQVALYEPDILFDAESRSNVGMIINFESTDDRDAFADVILSKLKSLGIFIRSPIMENFVELKDTAPPSLFVNISNILGHLRDGKYKFNRAPGVKDLQDQEEIKQLIKKDFSDFLNLFQRYGIRPDHHSIFFSTNFSNTIYADCLDVIPNANFKINTTEYLPQTLETPFAVINLPIKEKNNLPFRIDATVSFIPLSILNSGVTKDFGQYSTCFDVSYSFECGPESKIINATIDNVTRGDKLIQHDEKTQKTLMLSQMLGYVLDTEHPFRALGDISDATNLLNEIIQHEVLTTLSYKNKNHQVFLMFLINFVSELACGNKHEQQIAQQFIGKLKNDFYTALEQGNQDHCLLLADCLESLANNVSKFKLSEHDTEAFNLVRDRKYLSTYMLKYNWARLKLKTAIASNFHAFSEQFKDILTADVEKHGCDLRLIKRLINSESFILPDRIIKHLTELLHLGAEINTYLRVSPDFWYKRKEGLVDPSPIAKQALLNNLNQYYVKQKQQKAEEEASAAQDNASPPSVEGHRNDLLLIIDKQVGMTIKLNIPRQIKISTPDQNDNFISLWWQDASGNLVINYTGLQKAVIEGLLTAEQISGLLINLQEQTKIADFAKLINDSANQSITAGIGGALNGTIKSQDSAQNIDYLPIQPKTVIYCVWDNKQVKIISHIALTALTDLNSSNIKRDVSEPEILTVDVTQNVEQTITDVQVTFHSGQDPIRFDLAQFCANVKLNAAETDSEPSQDSTFGSQNQLLPTDTTIEEVYLRWQDRREKELSNSLKIFYAGGGALSVCDTKFTELKRDDVEKGIDWNTIIDPAINLFTFWKALEQTLAEDPDHKNWEPIIMAGNVDVFLAYLALLEHKFSNLEAEKRDPIMSLLTAMKIEREKITTDIQKDILTIEPTLPLVTAAAYQQLNSAHLKELPKERIIEYRPTKKGFFSWDFFSDYTTLFIDKTPKPGEKNSRIEKVKVYELEVGGEIYCVDRDNTLRAIHSPNEKQFSVVKQEEVGLFKALEPAYNAKETYHYKLDKNMATQIAKQISLLTTYIDKQRKTSNAEDQQTRLDELTKQKDQLVALLKNGLTVGIKHEPSRVSKPGHSFSNLWRNLITRATMESTTKDVFDTLYRQIDNMHQKNMKCLNAKTPRRTPALVAG